MPERIGLIYRIGCSVSILYAICSAKSTLICILAETYKNRILSKTGIENKNLLAKALGQQEENIMDVTDLYRKILISTDEEIMEIARSLSEEELRELIQLMISEHDKETHLEIELISREDRSLPSQDLNDQRLKPID